MLLANLRLWFSLVNILNLCWWIKQNSLSFFAHPVQTQKSVFLPLHSGEAVGLTFVPSYECMEDLCIIFV